MPLFQRAEPQETDDSWSFNQLRRTQTSYLTHDYHRYPAKFIPQLAERLIKENSKSEDLICDPFMGSGTTLLEAMLNSRRAYGSDIHPVSVLISRAKTTPIEPNYLKDQTSLVLEKINADLENRTEAMIIFGAAVFSSIIPDNKKIDYWFPEEQKIDLAIILSRINCVDDEDIRTFLLCGFSNILKACSRWMTRSTKPTIEKHKIIASAYRSFTLQIKRMSIKNEDLWNRIGGRQADCLIYNNDARRINLENESATLIITSPPYVTSYEYTDLHQLSAIWLRYIDKLSDFRSKFIGSVHKASHDGNLYSKLAMKIVDDLGIINIRESKAVGQYFFEMQECFREMHRILKHGGRTCIIIGDTQLRRVSIYNAEVFIESMHEIGFKTHRVIKRAIPNKILPLTRDEGTGRFCKTIRANRLAYPTEYILIMEKV
jgi:DNA modification methylase